jgi:hypothetical protein
MSSKSGATEIMKEKFPSLIAWQSADHRLKIPTGDTVKSVTGIEDLRHLLINLRSV